MIKPLNTLNYTSNFATPAPGAASPNPHETRVPRLAFGVVGAALATVTIAVSVILPARLDVGGDEPRLHLASQAVAAVSSSAGPVMTITVVGAREPRSSTGSVRTLDAAPNPAASGETISSPILRISTAAR